MTNRFWTITGLLLLLHTAATAQQADPVKLSAESMEYTAAGTVTLVDNVVILYEGSKLTSQRAVYNRETGQMTATGRVVLTKDNVTLKADAMSYNAKTEDASAQGNVQYDNGERQWEGESIKGNVRRDEWDIPNLNLFYEPFHIISPETKKVGPGHFRALNAIVTTCEPDDMEFYVRAKVANVYEERIIQAEGVKFYLNDIPIMYLPSYTVDLDREHTNFDVLPGYGSRTGAFLLTAYSWYLNEDFYTTTHLDVRSERGFGAGQDLRWRDSEDKLWRGLVTAYFTQDDKPYKSIEQEERERGLGINIDDDPRYRFRANHTQTLSDYENLFVEMNYMSDPEVTKDFFDEEYRLSPDPENRVSYIYTDRYIQAGLEVKKELNDEFFSSVNRIPEATLDVSRIRIKDTPFYYESENAGAFLEQTFSEFDAGQFGIDDFESLRLHSSHTLLYPKRYMRWLNVIPRIGYTGTYYGDTPGEEVNTDSVISSVDTNGVVNLSTNTVTSFVGGSAELRSLFEIGVETSFKAFKVIDENGPSPTGWGRGLRHVVEPFADYSFVPEPNVRSSELFQFDEIDELDERNEVTFGVRNKFQTKYGRGGEGRNYTRLIDLVDAEISTSFRLDPEEDQESLGPLNFDIELRPIPWLSVDTRVEYDTEESEIGQANSQIQFWFPDESSVALDHFYRPDRQNVVQAEFDLWPEQKIGLEGYVRYEAEQSLLEEQMIILSYKADCVGYGLGFRWIEGDEDPNSGGRDEDDWRVWVQIWLLAFPNSVLQMGGD